MEIGRSAVYGGGLLGNGGHGSFCWLGHVVPWVLFLGVGRGRWAVGRNCWTVGCGRWALGRGHFLWWWCLLDFGVGQLGHDLWWGDLNGWSFVGHASAVLASRSMSPLWIAGSVVLVHPAPTTTVPLILWGVCFLVSHVLVEAWIAWSSASRCSAFVPI